MATWGELTQDEPPEEGTWAAAAEGLRKRGTLERITRLLTVGERFTAGGSKRTGVLDDKEVNALEILGKMVTRPREFARGGMEAVRGDYDWQRATQEIAPRGSSGAGKAIAGLVRGVAYDPLTYVPLSWPGKVLKHGGRLIPGAAKAGEALKATKPIAALARARRAQGAVSTVEREARRMVSAAEPEAVKLSQRAAEREAVTSYTQRGVEDAMQEVYGKRGADAVAEATAARKAAKLAKAQADRLAKKATAHTKRAAEIRGKGTKGVPLRKVGQAEGRVAAAEAQATTAGTAEEIARREAAAAGAGVAPTRPLRTLIGAEQRALGKAGTEAAARVERLRGIPMTEKTIVQAELPRAQVRLGTAPEAERAAKRLEGLQKTLQKAQERAIRLEGTAGARAAQQRLTQASKQVDKAQRTVLRLQSKVADEQARAVGNVERLAAAEEARAVKATAASVQAQQKVDLAVSRAQQLGMKQAQVFARRNPKKAYQAVDALAQRNAIPEAHAAARGYVDATIDRIRRGKGGQQAADEVQQFFADLEARATQRGEEQARFGVRAPEETERWGEFHVRRFYERYATPEKEIERLRGIDPDLAAHLERMNQTAASFAKTGAGGIPASAFKRRDLLPRTARTALGELPLSQKIVLGERAHVAATSEAYRLQEYAAKWGRKTLKGMSEGESRHWFEVPTTDRWGALKDTPYVPKWLAAHLGLLGRGSGWEHRAARLASWALTSRPGEATGWYAREVMGTWKFLHTAGNLPTATRNMVTNGALSYLIGKIPAVALPRAWADGIMAIMRQSPEFEMALKLHPGFSATWSKAEINLMRAATTTGNWTDALPVVFRQLAKAPGGFEHGMSRLYELSEQAAKMSVYLYHTKRGMNPKAAAELAMKAIFDYGDVSRVVNWARRYGAAPFITYPLKAAGGLIPAAVTDTGKFASLTKAVKAPGFAADVGDMEMERKYMTPEQRGSLMRLPIKTREGETRYAEVGYYLPWGPWQEGVGFSWLDTMPIARVVEDIARNESSFSGRPIYNEAVPGDKWPAIALYLKEFVGPRWLVSGIGRIAAAVKGKPKGRTFAEPVKPDWRWEAAQQLGGLRTQGISVDQLRAFRGLDLRAKQRDIRSYVGKAARKESTGEITPQELEERRRRALDALQYWREQAAGP